MTLTGLFLMLLNFGVYSQELKQSDMEEKYYFKTTVQGDLEQVKEKTEEVFKSKGFGLISELPMHETLMEKLEGVELRPYYIMGFCNPGYAYKTLQLEENIGLFLPCKVIVRDNGNGTVDVVAINPAKAMESIGNPDLEDVAGEVTDAFRTAIDQMPDKL